MTLAQARIDDAVVLCNAGKYSSAYYLAGYAIELAIKACISDLFQTGVIPDKGLVNATYVHDIEKLVNTAGLKPVLQQKLRDDPEFAAYWGIASQWNEQSRYSVTDPVTATHLIVSINDPEHGVLQWLKQHW
ncbi:HEPN domain-containing protein [Thiomicrorhabdus sp. ZW0627]|uniref:HEPN domain-containing protein n=1 Tax=Thiomicrorhabdus sp. ZW0627 TaxID=3039774 RepID=UPI0024371880|nr:HEPN domain-containing protein [Thiomicrorhabdus sp. ZW0627]MDG6773422.1 HEPN domain-containing protein [Thiomicrorhabdus sp. ZW0627]